MPDYVDIQPATVAQVHQALKGRMVFVDDDVQGIATQLREIDEQLRLHYDPNQDIWVVTQLVPQPDGSETDKLVTSQAGQLDQRILQRVRQISGESYDLAADIEAAEAQAKLDEATRHVNAIGEPGERLLHAMRKDLGYDQDRIFVSKQVKGD